MKFSSEQVMEIGLVQKVDIDGEMQQAYLDYAMSVIVARALPDARDGLKPVHRRILYAMYDMGLRPDGAYKKSARIVGEVLGKYHPHGDMAVYESMARMAQNFSMRYTLVDGQGNFGSVDGDPPAAMRYTEARLAAPSIHMITDIDRETVDFADNFDGSLKEPSVLPSAIPNLLVNGATGIAVGMATSIPPHNLGEVVDALQFMLTNWEKLDDITVEELMRFVKGPDFPTGGIIIQDTDGDGLIAAYSTGRGRVTLQASAHQEEMERGRNRLIVTELPYMTNKSSLIERIAELARENRIEGIVDLRDESDRQGMRIVIELSKNADPDSVLRDLYRHTPMQSTFSIIMLALVNGEPRHLSLKQALHVYLEHRLEVIRRRAEYDLSKARQRAHILEGLRIALQNLDEVIAIIRKSPDVETARQRLIKRFKLSEIQAQAILDIPLRRLAALERKKIEDEYRELVAQIKTLEALLKSQKKMRQVVSEELLAVKEAYADQRRTHIVRLKEGETKTSLLTKTDLLEEKEIWISLNQEGLIWRTAGNEMPSQSVSEAPVLMIRGNSRDTLYLVGESGEAAAIPVHAVPETNDPAKGVLFHTISPFSHGTKLAGMFSLPARSGRHDILTDMEKMYILTGTRQGMLKKSALSELPGASASLFTLVKVNEGDRLGWLQITNGGNEILLVTVTGMAIRFNEESIRPMGLPAAGVMGIKLQDNDELCGMVALSQPGEVLLVSAHGKAKRLKIDQFPLQGRYGLGVSAWKTTVGDQLVGLASGKPTQRLTLHFNKLAPKAIRLDEAPLQNRPARGSTLIALKPDQLILQIATPWLQPRPGQSSKPAKSTPDDQPDEGGTTHRKSPKPTPAVKTMPTAKPKGGLKTSVSSKTAAAVKKTTRTATLVAPPKTAPVTKLENKPEVTAMPQKPALKTTARKTTPETAQDKTSPKGAVKAATTTKEGAASQSATSRKTKTQTTAKKALADKKPPAPKTSRQSAVAQKPVAAKKSATAQKPVAPSKPASKTTIKTTEVKTHPKSATKATTTTKKDAASPSATLSKAKTQTAAKKPPASKTTQQSAEVQKPAATNKPATPKKNG